MRKLCVVTNILTDVKHKNDYKCALLCSLKPYSTFNMLSILKLYGSSERVSDGKMQALAVLEIRHIVETALVWQMESDAPVYSDDKEV